jgi:hypothetical protein
MEGEIPRSSRTPSSWPTCEASECRGIQAPGYTRCLRHLDPVQLDEVLTSLGQGKRLDARGTEIDARLLRSILDAFPRGQDARSRVKASFTEATFIEDAWFDFVTFEIDAEFSNANFCGRASFDGARFCANASFNDCSFRRQFTSMGAHFEKDADFSKAHFSGPAIFDRSAFSGQAIFKYVLFSEDSRFLGSRFGALAEYSGCAFESATRFDLAHFQAQALFEQARFQATSSFCSTRFLGDVSYRDAQLLGDTQFVAADFFGTTSFASAQVADTSFERAVFAGDTLFLRTAFRGPVTLREAKLEGPVRIADISGELNLQGADVSRYAGRHLPVGEVHTFWSTLLEILQPVLDGVAAARLSAENYMRLRRIAKERQGRESEHVRASSLEAWKRMKRVDVEGSVPGLYPPSDLSGNEHELNASLDPSSEGLEQRVILWTRALQVAFERSGLDAMIPGFLFSLYGFGSPGVNDEENVLAVIAQATSNGPVGRVTSIRVGEFSFPVFVRRPHRLPTPHGSLTEYPRKGAAACWAEINDDRPPGSRMHGVLTAGHVVGMADARDPSMIVGQEVEVVSMSGAFTEGRTQPVLAAGNHFIDAAVVAVNDEQWDPGPALKTDATPGVGTLICVYVYGSTSPEYTTITGVTETGAAPLSPYRQNWLFLEDAFRDGDSGCLASKEDGLAVGLYIGDWPTGQMGGKIWGRCQNLAQIASCLNVSLFDCRGV